MYLFCYNIFIRLLFCSQSYCLLDLIGIKNEEQWETYSMKVSRDIRINWLNINCCAEILVPQQSFVRSQLLRSNCFYVTHSDEHSIISFMCTQLFNLKVSSTPKNCYLGLQTRAIPLDVLELIYPGSHFEV